MIKNKRPRVSFLISLVFTMIIHFVIISFAKNNILKTSFQFSKDYKTDLSKKIDNIKIISPNELEQIKKVGIKNGIKKKYFVPDLDKPPEPIPLRTPTLSLENLAPKLKPINNAIEKKKSKNNISKASVENEKNNIYFNPKEENKISNNRDQDILKQEAYKNISASQNNPIAEKLSNFEIRYERPEGVSEDELNSDEKAYYSFFKRSYANYLSKLYATYDQINRERPRLQKDFANKHLLIARVDYDENGNIILVKILKSSESDDVHYFFEETLKQLNLPNPPRNFIKNKKKFSTFYQIQIN